MLGPNSISRFRRARILGLCLAAAVIAITAYTCYQASTSFFDQPVSKSTSSSATSAETKTEHGTSKAQVTRNTLRSSTKTAFTDETHSTKEPPSAKQVSARRGGQAQAAENCEDSDTEMIASFGGEKMEKNGESYDAGDEEEEAIDEEQDGEITCNEASIEAEANPNDEEDADSEYDKLGEFRIVINVLDLQALASLAVATRKRHHLSMMASKTISEPSLDINSCVVDPTPATGSYNLVYFLEFPIVSNGSREFQAQVPLLTTSTAGRWTQIITR